MKQSHRPSILIGIALYEPEERFISSLKTFLKQCENHYDLELLSLVNSKELPDLVSKQNYIADYFLKSEKEYLLLLESDMWGFERNHLKALLRSNSEVCGMNYFSRWYPYYSCNMRKVDYLGDVGQPLFAGLQDTKGYRDCDLVGYGMTLYKREVFEHLARPFFRLNKFGGEGSYATDIDFSERCKEANIRMVGCFEYTLNHRDVTPQNVGELRINGMKERRQALLKEKGWVI
jgi:hypothetical protein